jgi:hypothetical protein
MAPESDLREAATAVGFRFLERLLSEREAAASRLGTVEGHEAWLRSVEEDIDRLAQQAAPGPSNLPR